MTSCRNEDKNIVLEIRKNQGIEKDIRKRKKWKLKKQEKPSVDNANSICKLKDLLPQKKRNFKHCSWDSRIKYQCQLVIRCLKSKVFLKILFKLESVWMHLNYFRFANKLSLMYLRGGVGGSSRLLGDLFVS